VCALIDGAPGPRVHRNPSEYQKLLVQLRAEMGKNGSNLNQGAKSLHEIRLAVVMDGITEGRLLDLLDDMAEQHRQAIEDHRRAAAAVERALGLRPDADRDY
jgi:hypothetical protein